MINKKMVNQDKNEDIKNTNKKSKTSKTSKTKRGINKNPNSVQALNKKSIKLANEDK